MHAVAGPQTCIFVLVLLPGAPRWLPGKPLVFQIPDASFTEAFDVKKGALRQRATLVCPSGSVLGAWNALGTEPTELSAFTEQSACDIGTVLRPGHGVGGEEGLKGRGSVSEHLVFRKHLT